MKLPFKSVLALACLILAGSVFSSCNWEKFDTSPEPEHPLYVTYTISAGNLEFNGPDQLLHDIQGWIKENQEVYDKKVNYTTGELSEFSKTDTEAVKKYEEFTPKFRAYLKEMTQKLDAKAYGDDITSVSALFYVAASRTQGESGNLKYEQIKYSYP